MHFCHRIVNSLGKKLYKPRDSLGETCVCVWFMEAHTQPCEHDNNRAAQNSPIKFICHTFPSVSSVNQQKWRQMLQDQEVILTDTRILSQGSVLILTIIGAINYSSVVLGSCHLQNLRGDKSKFVLIKFEGIKGSVFYFCFCVFKPPVNELKQFMPASSVSRCEF